MKKLSGRCAVVTGASRGIGLHIARRLASEGMNLVLAARSQDRLESAARELRGEAVKVLTVPTDATRNSDLERLVSQAEAEFGAIDVLINNAGIETYCPTHELTIAAIEGTVQLNLTAALTLTRLVLPGMLAAKRGHIVNISSTAGKHGPAFGIAYGATKAALISMTESLRGEYKGRGVSASVICPGFTDDGGIYEEMKAAVGKGTPAQMGSSTADAVGRAVLKAIRRDRPELLVNWPPMRPVTVLAELFPRVGEWLVHKATFRFLKRIATKRPAPDGNGERRAA